MKIRIMIRKIARAIRRASQPWQDRDAVRQDVQKARKLAPPLPTTWPGHRNVTKQDGESQEAWQIRRDNHRKEIS